MAVFGSRARGRCGAGEVLCIGISWHLGVFWFDRFIKWNSPMETLTIPCVDQTKPGSRLWPGYTRPTCQVRSKTLRGFACVGSLSCQAVVDVSAREPSFCYTGLSRSNCLRRSFSTGLCLRNTLPCGRNGTISSHNLTLFESFAQQGLFLLHRYHQNHSAKKYYE